VTGRRDGGTLSAVRPGLLVATTGVGAGDLAAGALAGLRPGTAVRRGGGVGARVTVFSSLLGVRQAVPYIVAVVWRLRFRSPQIRRQPVNTRSSPCRLYPLALAVTPTLWLGTDLEIVQKGHAVIGRPLHSALPSGTASPRRPQAAHPRSRPRSLAYHTHPARRAALLRPLPDLEDDRSPGITTRLAASSTTLPS